MQAAISSKAKDLAKRLTRPSLHQDNKIIVRQLVNQVRLKPIAKGYDISLNLNVLAECLDIATATTKDKATITTALKLKICNNGKKVIIGNSSPNPALITAMQSAHQVKGLFMACDAEPLSKISKGLNMDVRLAWRTLKLAYLAPDIQLAIFSGTQPKGLLLKDLTQQTIPTAWDEQRVLLGFS